MPDTVPEGFSPFTRESPLLAPWKPLFARQGEDRVVIGLTIAEPHCNSRQTAHGGLLAALADQAMGMSASLALRDAGLPVANLWTTSMTVDYLGAARLGQWLEFDTVFTKGGRTSCHAEADIRADGKTVARARGAFRVALQEETAR